jgi:hypothetical protein
MELASDRDERKAYEKRVAERLLLKEKCLTALRLCASIKEVDSRLLREEPLCSRSNALNPTESNCIH